MSHQAHDIEDDDPDGRMKKLNHTKYECRYHVVFNPKYRKKRLYGELRRYLGMYFESWRDKRSARYWKDI